MIVYGISQKKSITEKKFFIEKKTSRGYHSDNAGVFFLYIQQCAKIQVKLAEISFCTEEISVEVKNVGSESYIRFMDPISRVIYCNYTLTLCNRVYPNAFVLSNGSRVLYVKQQKLIRTPKENGETGKNMSSLIIPVVVFSLIKI